MTTGFWDTPTPSFMGTPAVTDAANKTGLLLAEDDSLKWYVSGLSVPTRTGTDPVPVWFRYPEGERRKEYPFITIDFLGINPSYERWTSIYDMDPLTEAVFYKADGSVDRTGLYNPSVSPTMPGAPLNPNVTGHSVDPYLMHRLLYQVTIFSRSAQHDRLLTSRFLTDVFPPRPFWIPVDADHTLRRAELLEMAPNDTLETTESGSKRIFRKSFTVSMDAELLQSQILAIEKASTFHLDVYQDADLTQSLENPNHISSTPHTLSEPVAIGLAPQTP